MDTRAAVGVGIVGINDVPDEHAEGVGAGHGRPERLSMGEHRVDQQGDRHTGT